MSYFAYKEYYLLQRRFVNTTAPQATRAPQTIDIEKARQETPGCKELLHFNNAGAALIPQPVLDAHLDHLRREAIGGAYDMAAEPRVVQALRPAGVKRPCAEFFFLPLSIMHQLGRQPSNLIR